MSINPVPVISSMTEEQAPDAHAQSHTPHASPQPFSKPDPKPEPPASQNSNLLSQLPQDEVEVQRDTQADGAIVIRYMDRSGDLILQVPTEQVLNVSRGIDQDVQRQQKARAEVEGHEGGK